MSLLWRTALEQVEAAKPVPTWQENVANYHRSMQPLPHTQTLDEFAAHPQTFWHGSPNGQAGVITASNGIHVGTQQAAREALNARIGTPQHGDWDGTREYGKTLLVPGERTGYGTNWHRKGWGSEPRYPDGSATYGTGKDVPIPLDVKPHLFPVRIIGEMTNTRHDPHPDFHANGYMSGQIKRGRARRGYYYRNVGEDEGSVSAVVPDAKHLATHEQFVRHIHNIIQEHNASGKQQHFLTGTIHPENVERYGL